MKCLTVVRETISKEALLVIINSEDGHTVDKEHEEFEDFVSDLISAYTEQLGFQMHTQVLVLLVHCCEVPDEVAILLFYEKGTDLKI